MNLIIYLVIVAVAVIGWVATVIVYGNSNPLLTLIVTVINAFVAGYFFSPVLGLGTINDTIFIPIMQAIVVGSIVLLAILNLFRERRMRTS